MADIGLRTINGSQVYLGSSGTVIKGPKALLGKSLSNDGESLVRVTDTRENTRTETSLAEKFGGDKYLALNGTQRYTIRRRVEQQGMSLEEAYTKGFDGDKQKGRRPKRTPEELVKLYGEKYLTLSVDEKRHFRQYVNYGNSIEQAYDKIEVSRTSKGTLIQIIQNEALEKYGSDFSKIKSHNEKVRVYHLTNRGSVDSGEKATNLVLEGKKAPADNRKPKSKGIDLDQIQSSGARTFYYRQISKGMSPEEAFKLTKQNYDSSGNRVAPIPKRTSPNSEFIKGLNPTQTSKFYKGLKSGMAREQAREFALTDKPKSKQQAIFNQAVDSARKN